MPSLQPVCSSNTPWSLPPQNRYPIHAISVVQGLGFSTAPRSTTPPFITKSTFSITDTSPNGSPGTATRSANFPASIDEIVEIKEAENHKFHDVLKQARAMAGAKGIELNAEVVAGHEE